MSWQSGFPVPSLGETTRKLAGLGQRVNRWRGKRRSSPLWTVAVAAIMLVMALPIVTVVVLALTPEENIWPHLVANVLFGPPPAIAMFLAGLGCVGLSFYAWRPTAPAATPLGYLSVVALVLALGSFPGSIGQTVLLMSGAGILTIVTGTVAAWLVTMYRFPSRAIVDRLLVIPLAMPTYIIAYAYVELLDYAGPLQTFVRDLFGFRSSRDYWFPEIRSIGGAVFIMASVLYPYVYLTARASFVQQSVCALEVARTLGRTPLGVFWAVALPLARPALVAGVALVLMECLNDIGAVEYLGVQTLTASVYSTWMQRSNLGGAAQIATVMLGFIVVLFAAERMARGSAQIHHTTGRYRSIPFHDLTGWKGYTAAAVCAAPFVAGFLVPVLVLIRLAWTASGRCCLAGIDARLRQTGGGERIHTTSCPYCRAWICRAGHRAGARTADTTCRPRQQHRCDDAVDFRCVDGPAVFRVHLRLDHRLFDPFPGGRAGNDRGWTGADITQSRCGVPGAWGDRAIDASAGAFAVVAAGTRLRRAAGVCRCDERAASYLAIAAVQFRYPGHSHLRTGRIGAVRGSGLGRPDHRGRGAYSGSPPAQGRRGGTPWKLILVRSSVDAAQCKWDRNGRKYAWLSQEGRRNLQRNRNRHICTQICTMSS